jgi:hypothetical protein
VGEVGVMGFLVQAISSRWKTESQQQEFSIAIEPAVLLPDATFVMVPVVASKTSLGRLLS